MVKLPWKRNGADDMNEDERQAAKNVLFEDVSVSHRRTWKELTIAGYDKVEALICHPIHSNHLLLDVWDVPAFHATDVSGKNAVGHLRCIFENNRSDLVSDYRMIEMALSVNFTWLMHCTKSSGYDTVLKKINAMGASGWELVALHLPNFPPRGWMPRELPLQLIMRRSQKGTKMMTKFVRMQVAFGEDSTGVVDFAPTLHKMGLHGYRCVASLTPPESRRLQQKREAHPIVLVFSRECPPPPDAAHSEAPASEAGDVAGEATGDAASESAGDGAEEGQTARTTAEVTDRRPSATPSATPSAVPSVARKSSVAKTNRTSGGRCGFGYDVRLHDTVLLWTSDGAGSAKVQGNWGPTVEKWWSEGWNLVTVISIPDAQKGQIHITLVLDRPVRLIKRAPELPTEEVEQSRDMLSDLLNPFKNMLGTFRFGDMPWDSNRKV